MKTNHSLVRCFGLVLIAVMFPVSISFALTSGTVTDTVGSPVSGALVTFTDESDPENEFSGYTDKDGKYEIAISPIFVDENVPVDFRLHQNYPNPFNPSTTIPYSINKSGYVNISVYNIMGQKVRTLIDGYQAAGSHVVIWNGCDDDGKNTGAGVYIYQLKSINHRESRKMLLIDGGGNNISGKSSQILSRDPVMAKRAVHTDNTTYHVTIHGSNIVVFEQGGITLDEDKALDFIVKLLPGGLNLVTIPGGTFQMGDEFTDVGINIPVHTVTLDGFEMSTTEITYAQYAAYLNEALASEDINEPSEGRVTGKTGEYSGQKYINLSGINPANDQRCWMVYNNGVFSVEPGRENWPAGFVSWYGAKAFALYYGLDLPTEAEWEYAARGGKQYKYGTVDGTIDSTKANYNKNIGHPVDVGSYPPNPFGLYDMSGNVMELCNDWYFGKYSSSESVTNPTGAQSGSKRIGRGGGWGSDTTLCMTYHREYGVPYYMHEVIGIRVVRRPGGVIYYTDKLLPGGLNLATILGGTFQMGSNDGERNEEPVHTVTLDSFEMSTTEITYAQYAAYLNEALASEDINEPSEGKVTGKTGEYSGQKYINLSGYNSADDQHCWIGYDNGAFSVEPGYENRPAGFVSWYGAKAFAVYYGLDLPTEAEWEYAARGGKQYKYGTDDGTIDSTKANCNENIGHPVDVGSYPSNPFGLYDMCGNVWEFVNDWYRGYSSESVTNPTGPESGVQVIARGGSWFRLGSSSFRFNGDIRTMHDSFGFRVVRRPGGVTY